MPQEQTRQTSRRLHENLAVTLPFLLLFYAELFHHALWRDELNAFGISAGSPTVSALFQNVRYEGHPWLWYLLLWLLAKMTHDPTVLKWLQVVIGTGIYFVLGFLSPFRWWEKVLLFLTYYIAFEYTVLTRMYGIVLLAGMLYVRRRTSRTEGLPGNVLLLGLMASADVTGVFLSLAFLAEYLYSLRHRSEFSAPAPKRMTVATAAVVYLMFLVLAALSMWPQPDAGQKREQGLLYGYGSHNFHFLRVVTSDVVIPYLPTATGVRGSFWDTTINAHTHIFMLILPFFLLAYWLVLRRYPNLLVLLGTDVALTVAFGYLVYLGKPRHYGMTFLTFFFCLWMLRAAGKRIHPAAYVLLVLSALGGVRALAAWRPFSNDEATAAWLQQTGLSKLPLVGSEDFTTFGVAVALQQPMYMLDCNCERSFLRINSARDSYTWDQLPERMPAAYKAVHADKFALVTEHVIAPKELEELRQRRFDVTLLKRFTEAEVGEDNFEVYLVQVRPKA